MARFEKQARSSPTGARGVTASGPPFDIADYTAALREMAATARELQALVQSIDAGAPALSGIAERANVEIEALVDKLFWRIVLFAVIVIAAVLAAAVP